MQMLRKLIHVTRQFGPREALEKGFSRVQKEVGLGGEIASAHAALLLSPPSNRAFMGRIEGEWSGPQDLLAHLREKRSVAFPFSSGERERFVNTLCERFPEGVARTIRNANRVCRHAFTVLGHPVQYGESIDWHLDPESGEVWPLQYVNRMRRWFWTAKRPMDWLPVWEINRHQHFLILGQAYWLTRDSCYVDEVCEQIQSWIKDNPYQFGVNWFSVMEIAVRLISWCFTFYYFRESERFMDTTALPMLKSLYEQTRFVREHLTLDWQVQNNWLISQATGLVAVGAFFPEFAEAEEWVDTGLEILEREAQLQTFPDGVNKEQAVGYHRYVLDLLLLDVLLGRRDACPRSDTLEETVEGMLQYALYTMDPTGHLAQLGDTDEGWGFRFLERASYWDLRPWLAVGAVLFDREDFKFGANRFYEEAFWVLGEEGLETFERMPAREPEETSFAFHQGGHYVLRDDWTEDSDFLLVRGGEFGLGGEGFCAHAHCDLLSIVLWMGGDPLVVDSGTFSFHGVWRNYFRLTPAHNTVMIDRHHQADPMPDFFWTRIPRAQEEHFDEKRVRLSLPYGRNVTFVRDIYHPKPGRWEITDTLRGSGKHQVDWFFNMAPHLALDDDEASGEIRITRHGRPNVLLHPPQGVTTQIRRGWFSPCYGHKESTPLLTGQWTGRISEDGVDFDWTFEEE